jgi:adenylate kinase
MKMLYLLYMLYRGYTGQKLQSNLECEIFQVLREEAEESYRSEIIMTMKSNSIEDMSNNVDVLKEWFASWKPDDA